MREPPMHLSDDAIRSGLQLHYGLEVTDLTFLPLGHDASAWVYRVQAQDETSYFLKVRLSLPNPTSLLVPRYLHDHGVTQVIAPLPTLAQHLWAMIEDASYVLILYPFIAGTTGMDHGMTDQQWITYGAIVRQIHETRVTAELAQAMRQEQFSLASITLIDKVDAHIEQQIVTHPAEQEIARFWVAKRPQIALLKQHLLDLTQQVAQAQLPWALCHADIHTNNVLLDDHQQVWIVDWDETMLAPRERDLMFVIGGGISRSLVGIEQEQLFMQGYGQVTADPLALAYYRYAWAISDISEYAAQVLFRDDFGDETKRAGVTSCISLFEPGEIVDLAFGSLTSDPTDRHA